MKKGKRQIAIFSVDLDIGIINNGNPVNPKNIVHEKLFCIILCGSFAFIDAPKIPPIASTINTLL